MNQKRLKPIVMTTSVGNRHAQNHTQQVVLLKALQVTQDPKKLKQMIGVRTVAEVYRTLDKMAMRKEYHESLARAGLTIDVVTAGLAQLATNGEKEDTRLKALQTVLKSLGLEKYDSSDIPAGGTWEEELLKSIEKAPEAAALPAATQDYEVVQPEMPERMKKMRQEEEELTRSIYGG
jgi:hypothetical protein